MLTEFCLDFSTARISLKMFLELVIISADTKQKCVCQNNQKIMFLFQVWGNVELIVTSQFQSKVTITLHYGIQECLPSAC